MEETLGVLKILAVIFGAAFLVETLVEYVIGTPMEKIEKLKPYKWLIMYAAAVVGVVCAFVYKFDLIYLIGQFVGAPVAQTQFGIILTGAALGRGANYLHDFVKRFFVKPATSS